MKTNHNFANNSISNPYQTMDKLLYEIEENLHLAEELTNCKAEYKRVTPKRDIKHMYKKRTYTKATELKTIDDKSEIQQPTKKRKTTNMF